jgi:hypothetical protein
MENFSLDESIKLFQHYREEIKHEMELMLARLNALLISQSFLVIAYAAAVTSSNSYRSHFPLLIFPVLLAILGFVLAWEGLNGIYAARSSLWRWRTRIKELVQQHPHLNAWTEFDYDDVKNTQRAGEIFAIRPPYIFMLGWLLLSPLPFLVSP